MRLPIGFIIFIGILILLVVIGIIVFARISSSALWQAIKKVAGGITAFTLFSLTHWWAYLLGGLVWLIFPIFGKTWDYFRGLRERLKGVTTKEGELNAKYTDKELEGAVAAIERDVQIEEVNLSPAEEQAKRDAIEKINNEYNDRVRDFTPEERERAEEARTELIAE